MRCLCYSKSFSHKYLTSRKTHMSNEEDVYGAKYKNDFTDKNNFNALFVTGFRKR